MSGDEMFYSKVGLISMSSEGNTNEVQQKHNIVIFFFFLETDVGIQ